MNYLERKDAKYIELATDDSQRHAAIERLTKTRRWSYWYSMFMVIGFFILFVSDGFSDSALTQRDLVTLPVVGMLVVFSGVDFMRRDSDLRLLKLVDKLRR